MDLKEIIQNKAELKTKLETIEKNYQKQKDEVVRELNNLEKLKEMAVTNIDVDRVQRAEEYIYIDGKYNMEPKRVDVINDAINDIASGCQLIKHQYFGVKNYSSFGDQRHDSEYNTGPRHGRIVFRIGMIKDKRKEEISDNIINDIIYYLENFKLGKIKTKNLIQSS